jgi:hypothetical protein
MRYATLISSVLFSTLLLPMDEEPLPLLDTSEKYDAIPDSPHDWANFSEVVLFLQALHNNKDCDNEYKKQQAQKAYQRYYLCPSFSKAGGKKALKALAKELEMDLRFSLSEIDTSVKFAFQDIRAMGKMMAIIGTAGGIGVVIYLIDTRNSAMNALVVTNSSTYYNYQGSLPSAYPCSSCLTAFEYDPNNGSYYPVPNEPAVANCTDVIKVIEAANQTLKGISYACLNQIRPFFWIDGKNYYQVTCWLDGSLNFDSCNVPQVQQYWRGLVSSSYQFMVDFTALLSAIPATLYCMVSAVDGGCSYVGKKMCRAYQYCRGYYPLKEHSAVNNNQQPGTKLKCKEEDEILLDEEEIEDEL